MPRRPPRRNPNLSTEEPSPSEDVGLFGSAGPAASRLGERLRRLSLGLIAALITARAYWPGEDADAGSGLLWVLAVLLAAALGTASFWIGGRTLYRISWADAALFALVGLMALSVAMAADRRAAIAVAWEWVALAIAYRMLRVLPRDQAEIKALAGCLVATAGAVAAVGFYQIRVEDPQSQALYRADPEKALALAGVSNDPVSRKRFEDRLLESREPRSTFALANSLAGFLVGPAVLLLGVALDNVLNRDGRSRRGPALGLALGLALGPLIVILACLILTKSRSAWVGLIVGLFVIAWHFRPVVSRRVFVATGSVLFVGLLALGTIAAMAGQLDRLVLTESTKSMRYRAEWWEATWGLITQSSARFWRGVGPGNFSGPYLRYKLATSSEEIKDPHNLILEVWSSAGFPAALALIATMVLVLRETFGPSRDIETIDADAPRAIWIWLSAGIGGVVLASLLSGKLNPFAAEDMARLVVLTVGWFLTALCIARLWGRRGLPAVAFGAGFLAVIVNLLAAGGIGIPPVALGLWTIAALGQNVRTDRPCGRLRTWPERGAPLGIAVIVAALIGTFIGTNLPHWRCEAALAEAHEALALPSPDWERARSAILRAKNADHYNAQPWLELADLEFRDWRAHGSPPKSAIALKVMTALDNAARPPRDPDALGVQRLRIAYGGELLRIQGEALTPRDLEMLKLEIANAAARAVALYPNDASLNAALAECTAALGREADALRFAREALRLDAVTPHADRKLPNALRERLKAAERDWGEGSKR